MSAPPLLLESAEIRAERRRRENLETMVRDLVRQHCPERLKDLVIVFPPAMSAADWAFAEASAAALKRLAADVIICGPAVSKSQVMMHDDFARDHVLVFATFAEYKLYCDAEDALYPLGYNRAFDGEPIRLRCYTAQSNTLHLVGDF